MNRQVSIEILDMMIKRYGFGTLIAEFCNGVEVIESNDFYENTMRITESENQREKIEQCRNQFEYIDATIIMPQRTNRKAYILFRENLGFEDVIRKTIHEFVHLIHRCAITKNMILNDLYEIEDNQDYKLFYYLDEFLTKKREITLYYDLLHKNKKVVDDDVYINTMIKAFKFAKESSKNILDFMRNEIFAIAETMTYTKIFPDIFPKHFIENYANISGIDKIVNILRQFDSIDVYVKNKSELEEVIAMLERSYHTSHQK